jgi:hypothetical protein
MWVASGALAAMLCFSATPVRPSSPPTARAVLDMAQRVADRLEGTGDRETALEEIAIAAGRVDPPRAVALAERLASMTTTYSDGPLSQIALALIPTDIDRALKVLFLVEYSPDAAILQTFERSWEQYPAAARRLFDAAMPLYTGELRYFPAAEQRWLELSGKVARNDPALGKRIFEWALGRAQRAVYPEHRSELLRTAVAALLPRDRERALVLARQIPGPEYRAEALLLTAAALRRDAPDRSRALYREGVDYLQEMSHPEMRDYWRERLVRVWAEVDPIEAETLARQITDLRERNVMLYVTCREMGRQDVDRALRLARSLPPDAAVGNRDEALAAVAAGVAATDPDRALGIAQMIPDRYQRDEALKAVIASLARRRMSQAVALVPRLRDEDGKVFALLTLAQEKGISGSQRRQWLALAAASARRLTIPTYQVEWLTRIAAEGAGPEPDVAKRLLREAYTRALRLERLEDRAGRVVGVAETAVDREPAWAVRIVSRIREGQERDKACGLMAGPLARHDARLALRWAMRCSSLPDRCTAFVRVAEALASPQRN